MEKPTLTWIESVKSAVNKLQRDYHTNRGMLLTEGDLECHLFNKLMSENYLTGYHRCKNDSFLGTEGSSELRTSYVHSQVTWFKPDQQSGFEVDLTISDPKLLEVKNIELFEDYPSKGFAYDGPCVAIEIKFIRSAYKARLLAQEDYLKLRDKLIPAKIKNIYDEKYKLSNLSNIAFITIVGCKDKEVFEKARHYLGRHVSDPAHASPDNLFVCLFYQDEIIWNKDELCRHYLNYKALMDIQREKGGINHE